MGFFGFGKKKEFIDLTENFRKQQGEIAVVLGTICKELQRYKESAGWYEKALTKINDPELSYIIERKRKISERHLSDEQID